MATSISNNLEKFSQHCKKALDIAAAMAMSSGHKEIRPEHILYGLLKEKGSISSELLVKTKLDADKVKGWIIAKSAVSIGKPAKLVFSPTVKQIIKKTVLLAYLHQHTYIGTEHLLASLLQSKEPVILNIFEKFEVNAKSIEEQLILVLKSASKFPDLADTFEDLKQQQMLETGPSQSFLDFFAVELTSQAHQKKLDPIFCRDQETERLIEILMRRTKNNPMLLGEPGVGKTAIVEGLAKRIYEKKVPDLLLHKKIIALDLSAVVAGSMYRGDFESRLKQIIDEISQDPDKILFIDEIHTIIGAGAAMGSLDAANILKPALARGEIRCIGATTHDDFRKNIEKDQALARRFQTVMVREPDAAKARQILIGVKAAYEKFHHVSITDEAITTAVELADRYLTERFFPDKALDLIDEAAASARLKRGLSPAQKKIGEVKARLTRVSTTKHKAILSEKFNEAVELKTMEDELIGILEDLNKIAGQAASKKSLEKISGSDIKNVVAKMTGVPVQELLDDSRDKILAMPQELGKRILGQQAAIEALSNVIKRNRAGLGNPGRPMGAFIFIGPSGVGKTETAKALSEVVFGDTKALIRLDMSEYGEKFNVSKLIGAPAGYVGYEDTGLLTSQVRQRPYSVVLFDEFEKAHPDVFNLLLQILDAGQLTDATGRQVNFRNTVIILTSNAGNEAAEKPLVGFEPSLGEAALDKSSTKPANATSKDKMLQSLKDYVRPELLNRFDQVIWFEPLDYASLEQIFDLKIAKLQERLSRQNIKLEFTPEARNLLIGVGEAAATLDGVGARASDSLSAGAAGFGGRIIEKNIANLLETQLADIILGRKGQDEATIKVAAADKQLRLEVV